MSFDWMPTFIAQAEVATTDLPALDGRDLSNLLLRNQPLPERELFWRYRQQRVIRSSNWRLLEDETDGTYLFDLAVDPGETTNLAGMWPQLVDSLQRQLEKWEQTLMPAELITR